MFATSIYRKLLRILSFIKITPFDTATQEGRSSERYRRIALISLSSIMTKGVSILTAIISLPLTLSYLGMERYWLWMTKTTIVAMLGFADLGMGSGLLNAISEANGKDDREAAKICVSSTFFILLGIALFILLFPGRNYLM